ncbi:hypothetical protein U8V72_18135 [Priestia filamentosa]|uniref:hypothetical protein n=1 Tax=Priestia filamentosa TaxID=1402861 RepID=UPI00397E054B
MFQINDSTINNVFNSLLEHGNSVIFGGYIRDTLLNIEPKDIDITTHLSMQDVCNLYPHATVRESISGYTIISFSVNKRSFEVIPTLEDFNQKSYHADLNLNSLLFDGENLIDPTNSLPDFETKVIHGLGGNFLKSVTISPFIWFKPITLSASTGFKISDSLLNTLSRNKELISHINPSIKAQDAYRILDKPYTILALQYLASLGLVAPFKAKYSPKQLEVPALQKNYYLKLVLLSYATSFKTISDFIDLFKLPELIKNNFITLISLLEGTTTTSDYKLLNQKILIEHLISSTK